MPEREVIIVNRRGLHARAAAKFVKLAQSFEAATVHVEKAGTTVSGLSIMGLMMLAATPGTTLLLHAEGPAADAALSALDRLVANGFDETD
jgi:phosphocarrier protein HPr